MTRRRWSTKQRAQVFADAGGICHLCGGRIGVGEAWDADHVIALELGGDDDMSNLRPAHVKCHKAKGDHTLIAKAKRVEAKHTGTFRRTNTPVPGSRSSRWKKRLDGTVIDRRTGLPV